MRRFLAVFLWAASPAAAQVARVTETVPAADSASAGSASVAAPLALPAALPFSPLLAAPSLSAPSLSARSAAAAPVAAAAPAASAGAAAPAASRAAKTPAAVVADDDRYDIVLDLDATIIGKVPKGDSAEGLDVDATESVTVNYTDWSGRPATSTYLVRRGFSDFLRRARQDPRVGGIHIVSGSNQSRLNAVANAIQVDGRPLSQLVDSLIGGEFLHDYSPQDVPDEHRRPTKDLAVLGLKNLRGIDADLRRGDIAAALALPRDLVQPRDQLLARRRFLVIDDSPELVRGGARTEIVGVLPFKPAAKFVPKDADEAQRRRVLALRQALWAHQHGEFGRLADLIDRGFLPGTPDWDSAAFDPGVPGLEAAAASPKAAAH